MSRRCLVRCPRPPNTHRYHIFPPYQEIPAHGGLLKRGYRNLLLRVEELGTGSVGPRPYQLKGPWIHPRPSPLVDRIHDYPAVFDPCEVEIVHERLRQHFRRRDVSCDVEHHDLEIATHTPLRAPQYVGDHVFGRYLVEGPSGVLHPALRQLWVQAP